MDLVLEMCNTRSIHFCGVSGRQLGKLSPAAFLSLPLTLLSSVQGLQVRARLLEKLQVDGRVLFLHTNIKFFSSFRFRVFLD